jgi:hypothetical protein
MAGKNIGVTLLSVVVAVAAFVVSSISAQELTQKIEILDHARERWDDTSNSVISRDLALGTKMSPDVGEEKQRIQQKLAFVFEMIGGHDVLMKTEAVTSEYIALSGRNLKDYGRMYDENEKLDNLDQQSKLEKGVNTLLANARDVGTLMDVQVEKVSEELRGRERYVRYGGDFLSILAIIVAGIAQLVG